MKIIKGIMFSIVLLLIAGCVGILICALNPKLTASLAEIVQNTQHASGSGGDSPPVGGQTGTGAAYVPVNQPGLRTDWIPDGNGGYVIPQKSPEEAPQEVGGLSGYQPVEETAIQVPQEEADNLSSTISNGELGAEYDFPAELYPYYAMLEENMKLLYKQIYANAMSLTISFTPMVSADVGSVKTVFEAVCNDHPELFWLDTGYTCKYLKNGKCVEITLQYNETADRLEAAIAEWDESANAILAEADALSSHYEKMKYVHDALIGSVAYDAAAPVNQSAYSALVNGRSVCAGYARAFQYLMQLLGIPCYYCTGYSGQDHAWDIVKLDGAYVNVDVTWDDTEPATYHYFGKTDEEFQSTHMRTGLSVYLPACVGNGGQLPAPVTEGQEQAEAEATPVPTPLTWESRAKLPGREDKKKEDTSKITELDTIEKYYDDCEAKLKKAGAGDVEFESVVPEALWSTIERAYSSGTYKKGYVEDVLKALKVENFAIQLQVQRLSGGDYRLYHNVYTY